MPQGNISTYFPIITIYQLDLDISYLFNPKKLFIMKNLLKYLILVSLLLVGFYLINSCQQKGDSFNEKAENIVKLSKETPVNIYIDCVGSCNDPSLGCFVRVMPGSIACNCEGTCAMQVTIRPKDRKAVSLTDWTPIYSHFLDYIERIHGTQNHKVIEFSQTIDYKYELVSIVYAIDGEKEEYSLIYLSEIKNQKGAGITVVDCTGSCTSKEKCVENYNAVSGVISCGCEGPDCSMTIEHVADPQ